MWYRSLLRYKRWTLWPVLLLLVAGCAGADAKGTNQVPQVSPIPALLQTEIVLYFPHRSQPVLIQEKRTVWRQGEQPELVVLQELVQGPIAPEARAILDLPAELVGSELLGFKVIDGSLGLFVGPTVLEALQRSGEMGIYAVVNSLAQIERVKTVHFLLQGDAEPFLVGSLDIKQRLSPRWDLVQGAEAE